LLLIVAFPVLEAFSAPTSRRLHGNWLVA